MKEQRDILYAVLWSLGCVLLWLFLLWLHQPAFAPGYSQGHDRIILDSTGTPLAFIRHPEWRALDWLENIPPLLAAAAIAAEDRRFHEHHGIDFAAVARAAWQNLQAGRIVSGASTISMQLARLEAAALNQGGARGLQRKLKETLRALWLEAHYSKQQILAWYLNLAPFGGPLVGISAGSRFLLNKPPEKLSPAEAASLLALPQDPSRLLQDSRRLLERRNYILRHMAAAGSISQAELARALDEPLNLQNHPPPLASAPHFINALNQRLPASAPQQVATYLNPQWQNSIAYMVKSVCARMHSRGLEQAAVVVLRNRDRAVMAWVGSADFYNPQDGQVDGVISQRQPGSALKPFVYALALEQGGWLAQPMDDSPLVISGADGAFRPRDYDGNFRGQVSMRQALGSSLNVPAIRLALSLSPQSLLDALRGLGFNLPLAAQHYGPGLALGNGEVNLLALTNAFASLAEQGIFKPVRFYQGQAEAGASRALEAKAASLVTHVLADDQARALGFGVNGVLNLPFAAAVKTGTSQHHRDNWCVGYTADYTVGVWAGNFSGQPMQQVSGISGAAPLWRQVMLMLYPNNNGQLPPMAPGISLNEVCLLSGQAPGPHCPLRAEELLSREPPPCQAHAPALAAVVAPVLRLDNPAQGGIYILDPDVPLNQQALHCRLSGYDKSQPISWQLDQQAIGTGPRLRLPLTVGRHRLSASQGDNQVTVHYQVLAPGDITAP